MEKNDVEIKKGGRGSKTRYGKKIKMRVKTQVGREKKKMK